MKPLNIPARFLLATVLLCTSEFSLANSTELASIPLKNAEDFAPLPNSPWVIASSLGGFGSATGGLYAVNAQSGESLLLDSSIASDATAGNAQCGAPVPAHTFAPHGIALHTNPDGSRELLVVNHGGREAIEIFDIAIGDNLSLRWKNCLPLPPGAMANAVAANAAGKIFVTNMQTLKPDTKQQGHIGEVLQWQGENWEIVEGSSMDGPNGILVGKQETLYVASWTQGQLVTLTKSEDHYTQQALPLGFFPDNLRWSSGGKIIAAGFQTTPETIMKCISSNQDTCDIPSRIAVVSPDTLTIECSLSVELGMTTVAVDTHSQLWLGTARGVELQRIPSSALNDAGCDSF